jgi:hypothetical protein
VLPGLTDVIQPGLLQVQGELPVDGVEDLQSCSGPRIVTERAVARGLRSAG